MEIEGFREILSTIELAKELRNAGRFDIVKTQFFDAVSYDVYFENIMGVISSVFSEFYSSCDDENEEIELFIFSDNCISRYYEIAWEYGHNHNVRHDKNPYVIKAQNEVRRWMGTCHSTNWNLLGYTKTNKTAAQSKLIVYVAPCDCDNHEKLAYGLIRLYQFFKEECEEFGRKIVKLTASAPDANTKGLMAA